MIACLAAFSAHLFSRSSICPKLNPLFGRIKNTRITFVSASASKISPHQAAIAPLYALGAGLIFLLSGCASTQIQNVEAPKSLGVIASTYNAQQKEEDTKLYNERVIDGDIQGARIIRDIIVQNIRREIEIVYQEFESGLFSKKAAFEVETDIFELLLSTATTVTGAPQARTNLSALLTGTKGTRLSVDKNVFGEKTYSALVSQMRASRSKISALIFDKLVKDVVNYPLAEAEVDLVRLFNAGTIHDALVQLSTQAGASAETEARKEEINASIKLADATQEQVVQIKSIRGRFNSLRNNNDISTAKNILKALEPTARNNLTDTEVWEKLNAEIRKASNPAQLPLLIKAFSSN